MVKTKTTSREGEQSHCIGGPPCYSKEQNDEKEGKEKNTSLDKEKCVMPVRRPLPPFLLLFHDDVCDDDVCVCVCARAFLTGEDRPRYSLAGVSFCILFGGRDIGDHNRYYVKTREGGGEWSHGRAASERSQSDREVLGKDHATSLALLNAAENHHGSLATTRTVGSHRGPAATPGIALEHAGKATVAGGLVT